MQSFELVLSVKLFFSLLFEIMNLKIFKSLSILVSVNLPDQLVTILCNPV